MTCDSSLLHFFVHVYTDDGVCIQVEQDMKQQDAREGDNLSAGFHFSATSSSTWGAESTTLPLLNSSSAAVASSSDHDVTAQTQESVP